MDIPERPALHAAIQLLQQHGTDAALIVRARIDVLLDSPLLDDNIRRQQLHYWCAVYSLVAGGRIAAYFSVAA